jgi:hypothetical protein
MTIACRFGPVEADALWMDRAHTSFWVPAELDLDELCDARVDIGLMGVVVDLRVRVKRLLSPAMARGVRGYVHEGDYQLRNDHDRPRLYSALRLANPELQIEDHELSLSHDPDVPVPRPGRISQAQEALLTPALSLVGLPAAQLGPGNPPSLFIRLADRTAVQGALAEEGQVATLFVAALPRLMLHETLLIVLQAPNGAVLQFQGSVLRQRRDATQLRLDGLDRGGLIMLKKLGSRSG